MTKNFFSIRPLKLKKSVAPQAEGSCLVSMGNTQVLCVATVDDEVPPHAQKKEMGWVHAEYAMLPRSGERRTTRHRASNGGRSQEISRLIGRALRASVNLKDLEKISIIIDCDVLRADGGTRTAAINGGFVALVQALQLLKRTGEIENWPVKEFVGAVSVGLIQGRPVLDINYNEDKEAGTDLNVVMTEKGEFIEIQATAEGAPFSTSQLKKMLALAARGIKEIIRSQKKVLGLSSLN